MRIKTGLALLTGNFRFHIVKFIQNFCYPGTYVYVKCLRTHRPTHSDRQGCGLRAKSAKQIYLKIIGNNFD